MSPLCGRRRAYAVWGGSSKGPQVRWVFYSRSKRPSESQSPGAGGPCAKYEPKFSIEERELLEEKHGREGWATLRECGRSAGCRSNERPLTVRLLVTEGSGARGPGYTCGDQSAPRPDTGRDTSFCRSPLGDRTCIEACEIGWRNPGAPACAGSATGRDWVVPPPPPSSGSICMPPKDA